jgi:hypothetical protein
MRNDQLAMTARPLVELMESKLDPASRTDRIAGKYKRN